jgi:hypothetical protein
MSVIYAYLPEEPIILFAYTSPAALCLIMLAAILNLLYTGGSPRPTEYIG